jgi:hypothetical protein
VNEISVGKALALGLMNTFLGPLFLMLGLPAFGMRPGYWACWFVFGAAESLLGGFAVSLRARR